jgi:hypothetical protein
MNKKKVWERAQFGIGEGGLEGGWRQDELTVIP